jgi:hypothetical protein
MFLLKTISPTSICSIGFKPVLQVTKVPAAKHGFFGGGGFPISMSKVKLFQLPVLHRHPKFVQLTYNALQNLQNQVLLKQLLWNDDNQAKASRRLNREIAFYISIFKEL